MGRLRRDIVGDVVTGKVSRFTNFGVFVELGEGLEGLCHISGLRRTCRSCQDVAQLGQEMHSDPED